VAGEEGVVLRLAGHRRQRVLQAERAELLDRMRSEIDADPERVDRGRRLEHPDAAGAAAGVDRQRQRQAADAATDNDDVHRSSLAAPGTAAAAYNIPARRGSSRVQIMYNRGRSRRCRVAGRWLQSAQRRII
jgi:hypothetical protein